MYVGKGFYWLVIVFLSIENILCTNIFSRLTTIYKLCINFILLPKILFRFKLKILESKQIKSWSCFWTNDDCNTYLKIYNYTIVITMKDDNKDISVCTYTYVQLHTYTILLVFNFNLNLKIILFDYSNGNVYMHALFT